MYRVNYRNFGTHQSIVANHVCDVDGTDRAGVRWYELRKPGTNWSIHQQGTWSPNSTGRFMGVIAQNANGDIALGYNASGSTVFPSIGFTGRKDCHTLSVMGNPEVIATTGTANNASNRYGDYNSMSVDPVNNSFWMTANYNTATSWSTRIINFNLPDCAPNVYFSGNTLNYNVTEGQSFTANNCREYTDISLPVSIEINPTVAATVTLTKSGDAVNLYDYEVLQTSVSLSNASTPQNFTVRIYDDAVFENADTILLNLSVNANGGNAVASTVNQQVRIIIADNDKNYTQQSVTTIFSENFTNAAANGWIIGDGGTTGFDKTWFYPTSVNGSSLNGSKFAMCNSDDHGAGTTTRDTLYSPIINTAGLTNLSLKWDQYFRVYPNTYAESIKVDVFNGTVWTTVYTSTEVNGSLGAFSAPNTQTINISAFANANLRVRFIYDAKYDYWWAIDNVIISTNSNQPLQTVTNIPDFAEEYLGPNQEVSFYHPTNSNLIAHINNKSNHNFGCVRLFVDRAGTGATNNAGETGNLKKLTDKSIKVEVVDPSKNLSGFPYSIRLFYTNAEKVGWETASTNTFNTTDTKIIKNVDGIPNLGIGELREVSALATKGTYGNNWFIEADFSTGFSGFAVGNGPQSLPVQWLGLQATALNNAIEVNWQTKDEVNNKGFIVQKSTDGVTNFSDLKFVDAKNKLINYYSLTDDNIKMNTTYYYRLKQIDKDENYTFSKTVAAQLINKTHSLLFYPNPVNDILTVQFNGNWLGKTQIIITDLQGKQIVQKTITANGKTDLHVENLTAGVYLVQCINGSNKALFKMTKL